MKEAPAGLPRDARRRKTRTGATVFAELICSFFLDREKQVQRRDRRDLRRISHLGERDGNTT
jgi:hypothetical protein